MTPPLDSPYPRPRNPRACESCRASKVRCYPSSKPNVCQRCAKSEITCVVSTELRTRAARKPKHPVQVQEPAPTDSSARNLQSDKFHITLPEIPKPDLSDAVAVLQQHHEESFSRMCAESPAECPILKQKYPDPIAHLSAAYPSPANSTSSSGRVTGNATANPDSKRTIGQRDMTIEGARALLDTFREMNSYFPYVIVPEEASVECLAKDSPFLLLAVLTVGAAKDMELQFQLDHEFKRVLSQKLIVEGQKSLDFLQGLLIYTAWFPSHLRPRQVQPIMYMNMAISMSQDLGLDQQEPNSNLELVQIDSKGLYDGKNFSKAARRAHMGCYYLSAALSSVLQKPNRAEYNNTIEYHGYALAKEQQYPTDPALLPLVRSQHVRQLIHESVSQYAQSIMTSIPVHIENDLSCFRKSLTVEMMAMPYVVLEDRFLDIVLYSGNIGFLRYYYHVSKNEGQQSSAMLAKCVEGCKRFFDYLLSLPIQEYLGFTTVQWSTMIQAIVILSRLSFPLPTCPSWNPQIARETAPLMIYLDCLCYRFASLSAEPLCSPEPPTNPDAALIFKMVLESVKNNMEKRLLTTISSSSMLSNTDPITEVFPDDSATVLSYCPMLDPDLVGYIESCPGSRNDLSPYGIQKPTPSRGERSNIPVYHDLWATMTMSWAD